MKPIQTVLNSLSIIALLALAVGCASTKTKEETLVSAGFKIITPSTPAQEAKLQALPADKVTMVKKDGKTYYVFPDKAHNQAYVGGPKQLEMYRSLCADQRAANDNFASEEGGFDWGSWSGIGGVDAPGWY